MVVFWITRFLGQVLKRFGKLLQGEEGEEMYENEIDCIVKLVKKGGIGSLYSGMGPQLLGIAPEKVSGICPFSLVFPSLKPNTLTFPLFFLSGHEVDCK